VTASHNPPEYNGYKVYWDDGAQVTAPKDEQIIEEVQSTFPEKEIIAYIGGLHLYRSNEQEVLAVAEKIKALGIQKVITGHCTGETAFSLLKEQLGMVVEQIYTGLELEF